MCGRFMQARNSRDYAAMLGATCALEADPRYNLAPSQKALVGRVGAAGGRELVALRWGLIPAWSKGPDARFSMINARAETVADKPAFRQAYRHRRCLVPADGFFEWRAERGGKQPYLIRRRDGLPFAMAGLWESWRDSAGDLVESFTILVTDANAAIAPVHDRMPVVLEAVDYATWLDPQAPNPAHLLRTAPAEPWELVPVSRRINSPSQDDAGLIEAVVDRGDMFGVSN